MAHWLVVTSAADDTVKASQSAGDIAVADLMDGTSVASSRTDTITWRSHSTVPNQATDESTYDGVWISETSSSGTLGSKYESHAIPVVCCENGAWSALNFSAGSSNQGASAVEPIEIAESHHIASGKTNGISYDVSNSGFRVQDPVDQLGAGAEAIWQIFNTPVKCWLWVYETNALMFDGNPAEARRVALGMIEASMASLDTDGPDVLLATMEWALGEDVAGGGTFTGTIDSVLDTLPDLTQSASGTFGAAPNFAGTINSTLDALSDLTQSAAGTFVEDDPVSLTLTQQGSDVLLEWSAPTMSGATHTAIFRRDGTSTADFDPEVDTEIGRTLIGDLDFIDADVPAGDYAYQVFPVIESAAPVVSFSGSLVQFDSVDTEIWGIRVGSATQTQDLTDDLINQLDDYVAHGLNCIAIYVQGTRGANSDPFSNPSGDTVTLDPDHQDRIEQVCEAAGSRGMMVILGIFYQNAGPYNLSSLEQVRNAIRLIADIAAQYTHVIINVANEQNSTSWGPFTTATGWDWNSEARNIEACQIVHTQQPDVLVGAGGYAPLSNDIIVASSDVDTLLFDTDNWDKSSGAQYDRYALEWDAPKPIINVEYCGGKTKTDSSGGELDGVGVFFDGATDRRDDYYRDTDEAAAQAGLGWCFHASNWTQEPGDIHFELGTPGDGTVANPGIRWWFEYLRDTILGGG